MHQVVSCEIRRLLYQGKENRSRFDFRALNNIQVRMA